MDKKTAVVMINTGSPAAPTEVAVRAYLKAFLSDPRIIELPRWFWWPILHGFILRKRPAKSAARYRKIWTPEGSPLIVTSQKIVDALNERDLQGAKVALAMRYGFPSVTHTVQTLQKEGFTHFIFFPVFAQYATQTTEASMDAVRAAHKTLAGSFTYEMIAPFYNESAWIDAVAAKIRRERTREATHLVMSFHGIPAKCSKRGDPYEAQCIASAKRLAQALNLQEGDWSYAYQSRFGGDKWLQPYLPGHLKSLVEKGVKSIDVVCLSFSVDCLETVEEIGMGLKDEFLASGGQHFHLIGCLNDEPAAIDLYEGLIRCALASH